MKPFADPAMEASFLHRYEARFIANMQLTIKALLASGLVFAGFLRMFWPSHFGLDVLLFAFLPTMGAILALMYWQPFLAALRGRTQAFCFVAGVVILVGTEVAVAFHTPDYYGVGRNHMAVVYIIFLYVGLRLRFWWSVATAVSLTTAIVILQAILPGGINPRLTIFLCFTNVVGMWISWQLESYFRRDFATKVEAERAAITLKDMSSNVIPAHIASHLKTFTTSRPHFQKPVSDLAVLFSDLSGFTAFARSVSPQVLIRTLNTINQKFDAEADRLGIAKIKTLGDAAVYASGLTGTPDSAALKELAEQMLLRLDECNLELGTTLRIRIGLGRGSAITGVIGKTRIKFDIWGEAIEAAEAAQKAASPGEIREAQRIP